VTVAPLTSDGDREPGKRPGPRIEQGRVFSKKFARREERAATPGLMLTSLVDMFTIIVMLPAHELLRQREVLYMSKDIKAARRLPRRAARAGPSSRSPGTR